MKHNTLFSISRLAGLLLVLSTGCKSEEPPLGGRGETCRSRLDCAEGLACSKFRCIDAAFRLTATGKECVSIECRTPEDCCPDCAWLKSSCSSGSSSACVEYQRALNAFRCTDNQCVASCSVNLDCASNHCAGGRCVACVDDEDCSGSSQCAGNQCQCLKNLCQPKCQTERDCGDLETCRAGACVHVGCVTDRQCAALTGNPRTFCKETECRLQCSSDIDCDDPYHYGFRACINSLCADIGCESNEECRARRSSASSLDASDPTTADTTNWILPPSADSPSVLPGIPAGRALDAECRPQTEPAR